MDGQEVDDEKTMVEKEKKLFDLIGTCRGKLGIPTWKHNKIDDLMQAGNTKEVVKQLVIGLIHYLEEFEELQETVQSLLLDVEKEHDQND